jgi:hypothetical protein
MPLVRQCRTNNCHIQSDHSHIFDKELSSVALGGKIVSVSDEFFAEAFHLILVEVSPMSLTVCLSETLEGPAKLERPIWTKGRALQWLGNSQTQSRLRLVSPLKIRRPAGWHMCIHVGVS